VLTGEFKEGDTVVVDASDGKIVFWSEQYAQELAATSDNGKTPTGTGRRAN
jgi:hypothetical protein